MNRVAKVRQTHKKNSTFLTPRTLFIGGIMILLFSLALGVGIDSSASNQTQDTGVVVGQSAPQFQLSNLAGETVSLDDFSGNVVVLNFWATWCPPCRAEMPGIQSVYETHQGDGVTVIAINAQENIDLVSSFQEEFALTFPVLLDSNGQAMNLYQAHSLPTTIILDRNGVVRHIQSGPITAVQLETIISSLL